MRKTFFILLLLLALCLFLRLYLLEDLYYFMMDEALLAFRGWGVFALKRLFIIGGISPLGFHQPPYFYWFSAVFLPFSGFNPIIWGYLAAAIALLTVFILFFWSGKIGGNKVGLIAAFLYTTSFTAIFFDRHYWPLVFNPLLTIITLWLLSKNHQHKWLYLSLVLVFGVTADPSNLPLLILVVYSLLKGKEGISKKIIFFASFLILYFTPLIAFDIRHSGSNFQGIFRFLNQVKVREINRENLINTFLLPARMLTRFWYSPQTNISYFHTYCSKYALARQVNQPILLEVLAFILLTVYYFKKRKVTASGEIYIAQLLLIYLLGLLFYGVLLGRPIYDHYLVGLLPVFAFMTAKLIIRFWVVGFFILIIFFSTNMKQFLGSSNPYGLAATRSAVDWTIQELGDKNFALDAVSKCFRYNGIRYLYEIKNKPPAISFIDPDFFWLYKEKPANSFPETVVIFSDQKLNLDLPIIKQKTFGGWQISIVDNSKKIYKIEGP